MGKSGDVIDCLRIKQSDRRGRSFYVTVGCNEIVASVPSDARDSNDLLAVTTALTRMISISRQEGISWEKVKKQLQRSVVSKGDLPDLILRSIEKWEEKNDDDCS